MLTIFVTEQTQRVNYIFNVLIRDLCGIDFRMINDKVRFSSSEGAKLNYSKTPADDSLFIYSHDILFETGIKQQKFENIEYEGISSIFSSADKNSDFPFDIFAASFYLITRYEEYLPFTADLYGRFEASESISYRLGFIETPVINIWTEMLLGQLKKRYPGLTSAPRSYNFIPTYDIDIAFSYKYKGFFRTAGAYAKSLIHFDINDIRDRTEVLFSKKADPYDSYDYMAGLQEQFNLHPVYFIHPGTWGKVDKNARPEKRGIKKLLCKIGARAEIGIHPSFRFGSYSGSIRERTEPSRTGCREKDHQMQAAFHPVEIPGYI